MTERSISAGSCRQCTSYRRVTAAFSRRRQRRPYLRQRYEIVTYLHWAQRVTVNLTTCAAHDLGDADRTAAELVRQLLAPAVNTGGDGQGGADMIYGMGGSDSLFVNATPTHGQHRR